MVIIGNAKRRLSLRRAKWLRGATEANPEIPRVARNRLRNPMRLPRFARNDTSVDVNLLMTFTIVVDHGLLIIENYHYLPFLLTTWMAVALKEAIMIFSSLNDKLSMEGFVT